MLIATSAWAADFNGDGFHDYLIFNPSTRQTADWYLNGKYQFIGGGFGPNLPSGWNIVAVADFNRDGNADYLLFNESTRYMAVWYLNRGKLASSGYLAGTVNPGFTPIAVTDINLNGVFDVVFVYTDNTTYIMQDYAVKASSSSGNSTNAVPTPVFKGPTLAAGFLLVDAKGDFNADGKPDYLLFDPVTGRTAMWYLKGAVLSGTAYGPTVPHGWTVDSLADFNHDGRPDYLLNADRVSALWFLRGNILLGKTYAPTIVRGWSHALGTNRPCLFSISPTSVTYNDSASHAGNVYVSAFNFGCVWQVTSSDTSWLHVTRGGTVGSGYMSYLAEENHTGETRTGTLTFTSGKTVTIRQEITVACGTTQVAGGDAPVTRTVQLGKKAGTFNFSYNTYSVQDRMVVTYQGRTLFDTGCVGASDSVNLAYSGTSTSVTVSVSPNCAGGSGTQWTFTVGCPQ